MLINHRNSEMTQMKSKIFSLFGLGVLIFVILISAVSAVTEISTLAEWSLTTDGAATSVDTHVTAGIFDSSGVILNEFGVSGINTSNWTINSFLDATKYLEVTISPKTDYTLSISDISFDYNASATNSASFEVKYSKLSNFASPTSLTIKTDVGIGTAKTSSNSSLTIQISSGETLTLRLFGYNFDVEDKFFIKDLVISGVVAPEEITACILTESLGDLEINIEDKEVVSGFGPEDKEWYLFDEIEIEVEVEVDGSWDIDDIEIAWGLYDKNTGKFIIDDEENDFNLKYGDDKTVIIKFDLDDDLEDFEDADLVFYVWANGEIDDSNAGDSDGKSTCDWTSEEIEVITNDDFVIINDFKVNGVELDDLELTNPVLCGEELQFSADVWNIGEDDQDDVYVRIYNQELGISEKIDIGDIDAFEDEELSITITIPQDADEKWYTLVFKVYDEDDDIYETEEDEDESKFNILIKVEGGCSVEPTTVVSAILESGGQAGEELVIKTTITNTGSALVTYEINAEEYSDWASSPTIEPSIFILGAGESKEVLIIFNVNQEASGEKSFNILVTPAGGEEIKQPVSVSIESTASDGLAGITGNVISEGNWYLWAIGALNILLILIIIIVAMRVSKQ